MEKLQSKTTRNENLKVSFDGSVKGKSYHESAFPVKLVHVDVTLIVLVEQNLA